ncbi:MAG: GDP-mannose 4,6-dehydratase, partial [Candidatus Didemnitutus sp.]|nr:GDP-mannose 4,6-dehydratase [Candidatus Didemnitutus sp.]
VPTTNSQHPVTLKSDRFEFHTLDIEDLPALERVFARSNFSAVFNLAARAGVRYSMENPHVYLSTNAQGTLNILECMRKHGVKKQVLASTSSLYAGCPMPFTEDQPVNTPLSPYAASKKAAELMAYTYHRLSGIDTTVVRYFTVFGPAGRPDMAPFRFIEWIIEGKPIELYGDGSQSRDFTFVDDVARGTILAGRLYGDQLLAPGFQLSALSSQLPATRSQLPASSSSLSAPGYAIINLGGGNNPISLHALIALMEQCLGRKATTRVQPPHAADLKETWADIAKAERLLGWKPEVSTEEGIRRTVDWHLAQRDWLRALEF